MTISAPAKRAAIGLILITAAACQQGSVAPSVSPTTSPTLKPAALAACPAASASPGPQVLLQKQPAPDDLAFDNNGRLLFSDTKTGAVSILNVDGSVERVAGGMSAPEGIVVQADGRILVGEQGRNRVVAIDPQDHAVTQWHAFPNRTGRDGLDGIGPILPSKDAQGKLLPTADNVIVPDSPNGVVWRVSADGKTAIQIASGMVRPVGAAVDAAGRIFVADEGGALWVLAPRKVRFATLPTPDDVLVSRAGHIFVNTLGDNAIHELDSQGHQVGVITGIQQPQGIALDYADNLYYTEFDTGRIDRVIRTFVLDPPKVTRTTRGTYIICPVIRRAAGFNQPLGLATGSSLTTNVLQIVQPGTDSSGALEVQTSEHSITIGVDTTSGGVNLGLSQTIQLSPVTRDLFLYLPLMPTTKGGLEDVVAATSTICDIIGPLGKLTYRGIDIHDLARNSSFEETTYLLWFGSLPTREALLTFSAQLASHRPLPTQVLTIMKDFPRTATPMDALRTALSALAFYDPQAHDPSREANIEKAMRVTAQTATIVAAYEQIRRGRKPVEPEPDGSHAENFLRMLFGAEPDPLFIRAMDLALILHADHELNASTFAARVTAATLADMYSAMVSAIGALAGPLHGGANEQVMKMLQKIGEPSRVEAYVSDTLQAHQKISGFGHRVYKTEDPRATHLRQMSKELGEHIGNLRWYEISRKLEEVVMQQKHLYANVDFYSASCYFTMGIPIDMFTPVFAVSRTAGWAAHVLEQYADNRLIRPRAEYLGEKDVAYVPIDRRVKVAS